MEIERGGLGTTVVLSPQNKLSGIITDGDIRRMVASGKKISELTVEDIMTRNPRTLKADSPAYEALNIMEQHQITVFPSSIPQGRFKEFYICTIYWAKVSLNSTEPKPKKNALR